MHIVHVFVEVKPEFIEAFRTATLANARASLLEPGVARFDVMQETDQPTRFLLVEVYRTTDDPARHRETQHYKAWKETVAEMIAAPRTKTIYTNLFPGEEGWD